MDLMGHNFEHVMATLFVVCCAVSPVAWALLKFAKVLRGLADKTQNKTDDAVIAKVIFGLESFCGFLAKVLRMMPRMTVGK